MHLRQHPARPTRASTGGYSLIELVVVIVLVGLLGAVSFFAVLESMRVYGRTQPRIDASNEANFVASRIVADIRDIPDDQSIAGFTDSKLEFTSSAGEKVVYAYSGGVLLRNDQPLAEELQGLVFSYDSADGQTATTASDIHLVHLRLVAESAGEQVPMALTVFPRGLQR